MALKGFIDRDGKEVPFARAFAEPHRFDCTLATLRMLSQQETISGKFRVTELINGPRMYKLKRDTDWYIDPQDAVFMLLGTGAHYPLANQPKDKAIKEKRLEWEGITGQPDHFDFEQGVLTDYKVAGSYKVKKALGLRKKDGVWFTEEPDIKEWELQVNMYRILIEKSGLGEVKTMQIQAIVRDGGTFAARGNGIHKNMYLIPIKKIKDSEIIDYFTRKKAEFKSVDSMKPRLCNGKESWHGRRCKGYCPVADACQAMGDNRYLEEPVRMKGKRHG